MNPGRLRDRLHPVHYALFLACLVALALDSFIHRHVYHAFENAWGFYAWYGFGACVLLVIAAKGMRRLVMRPADYYDRDESGI